MGLFGGKKKNISDGGEIYEIKIGITLMQVYDNRVVTTALGVSKTLYFSEITAIEFKESGFTNGYIEFIYPTSKRHLSNEWYLNFNKKENEVMKEIKRYIDSKIGVSAIKECNPQQGNTNMVAEEILKLKGLLDAGILTQEEFESQKGKLLK